MKKKFKLQDLDCANCAAKMEEAIKKIDGVSDASVSFMTQKMTIEADDERFDAIMDEVARVCAKVEPDCKILRQSRIQVIAKLKNCVDREYMCSYDQNETLIEFRKCIKTELGKRRTVL